MSLKGDKKNIILKKLFSIIFTLIGLILLIFIICKSFYISTIKVYGYFDFYKAIRSELMRSVIVPLSTALIAFGATSITIWHSIQTNHKNKVIELKKNQENINLSRELLSKETLAKSKLKWIEDVRNSFSTYIEYAYIVKSSKLDSIFAFNLLQGLKSSSADQFGENQIMTEIILKNRDIYNRLINSIHSNFAKCNGSSIELIYFLKSYDANLPDNEIINLIERYTSFIIEEQNNYLNYGDAYEPKIYIDPSNSKKYNSEGDYLLYKLINLMGSYMRLEWNKVKEDINYSRNSDKA